MPKTSSAIFRSLFQPVSDLKSALEDGLSILRSKGKTIVGIHIRRGDYIKEPRVGFTLVFPTKWYCEWLEEIWNDLEDPVLLLCSDDLDSVIHDFDEFSPVTWRDLDIKLPERMKDLDIEFYIDFFMLSNCDIVVTSNSNFSFVACMLNQRAKMFVRPHWDFSTKFTIFDPWDSEPLLWLGGDRPKFFKSFIDILYMTYVTQGFWAMLKSLFLYLPKSRIKGKYLDKLELKNVNYWTINDLPENQDYDLIISNYAFSECTKTIQEIYLEKIINKSLRGYMTCNFISFFGGVGSYSKKELITKISHTTRLLPEKPLTWFNNIVLVWDETKN